MKDAHRCGDGKLLDKFAGLMTRELRHRAARASFSKFATIFVKVGPKIAQLNLLVCLIRAEMATNRVRIKGNEDDIMK